MPQTETEELSKRLESVKNFNSKQVDFEGNTDFIKENTNGSTSHIESLLNERGFLFLGSMMESGPYIQKAVKFTAIGFALSLLFLPLGIAIMTISAIACVTAIGAKLAHSYTRTKMENSYPKESTETKGKIFSEIVKELMEQKLSIEEIKKQQERENDIENDLKKTIETFIGAPRREVDTIGNVIKNERVNDQQLPFNFIIRDSGTDNSEVRKSVINTNESRLGMFTKSLNNSLNPSIKQDATASRSKAQQKEVQSANENMGMRHSKL